MHVGAVREGNVQLFSQKTSAISRILTGIQDNLVKAGNQIGIQSENESSI